MNGLGRVERLVWHCFLVAPQWHTAELADRVYHGRDLTPGSYYTNLRRAADR